MALIVFLSAEEAEQFLEIVTEYEEGTDTLYGRIFPRQCPMSPPAPYWKYDVILQDFGLEEEYDVTTASIEDWHTGETHMRFNVSIRFPATDIPTLVERMTRHNDSKIARDCPAMNTGAAGPDAGLSREEVKSVTPQGKVGSGEDKRNAVEENGDAGCLYPCKLCKGETAYLNVFKSHFFICDACQVSWCGAYNLFSSWQDETQEDWDRNIETLKRFRSLDNAAEEAATRREEEKRREAEEAARRPVDATAPMPGVLFYDNLPF
jgi:hypothetical protein